MDTTVVIRQAATSPIRTVVVKQTLPNSIRTIVVRQPTPNLIPTVVIRRGESAIKTIIINRGAKGEPGEQGEPGPIADVVVERILLSSENVANKSFPLSFTPANPPAIELTPIGGIIQIYGIDYVYSAGTISWAGYGLDGFLEASEHVLVRYLKGNA